MEPADHPVAYQRATIYFASGTGNSYRAACWLAEAVAGSGGRAELIPIDGARPREELTRSPDHLVGVCFPAHGFMPPWSMIEFLLRLPFRPGARAAVVATRGSFKLGPVVVPGAAGLGTFMAALLLLIKGILPLGHLSLDMPANMLNLHWGLHPKNVQAIGSAARAKLDRFAERILAGRMRWWTFDTLYELCWGLPLLIFVPLFPVLYLVLGRVFMAKLLFGGDRCNGCGQCARACPNGAIRMLGQTEPRPYWTHGCEVCMRCVAYCKRRAVQTSWPWAAVLALASSLPLALWLEGLVAGSVGVRLGLSGPLAYGVDLAGAYLALICLYWVFWGLTRLPGLNAALSYSTPTRYYRSYHDPETRLRDLSPHTRSTDGQPEDDDASGSGRNRDCR